MDRTWPLAVAPRRSRTVESRAVEQWPASLHSRPTQAIIHCLSTHQLTRSLLCPAPRLQRARLASRLRCRAHPSIRRLSLACKQWSSGTGREVACTRALAICVCEAPWAVDAVETLRCVRRHKQTELSVLSQ